jgi:hypothetical protein
MVWSIGIRIPKEIARLICDYISRDDPGWITLFNQPDWDAWYGPWYHVTSIELRVYDILTDHLTEDQRMCIYRLPQNGRGIKLLYFVD